LNFRDKIYVVPRRESSVNSPDGLNFGNMFWLPELITNMPISRNGQISNEFTVQTRRRHICHCPIMIRIDLDNMDKVIDTKVATAVIL
jgi:signal transduction histidine kinase